MSFKELLASLFKDTDAVEVKSKKIWEEQSSQKIMDSLLQGVQDAGDSK